VLGRESKRLVSIKEGARNRVLSDDELRKVWLAAEQAGVFGAYVRFVLLTATRRNEASEIRHSELEGTDLWLIPWQRYKTGAKTKTDMAIPLSEAAQAIIAAQPNRGEYIFSHTGKNPLGNFSNAKRAFDAACGVKDWHLHDLRRTARTLLSKVTTPDIAERCLGHVLLGQRATYDWHRYEDEMRAAFEALASLIDRIAHPPPAEVADFAEERGKRLGR
jgi:integrase